MSDHRRRPPLPPATSSATGSTAVPVISRSYVSKHKASPREDSISSACLTHWVSVDVSASVQLITKLRARDDYFGARVSPLLLVARSGIEAFKRQPLSGTGDAVDLGVAIETSRGLAVSQIEHAQSLTLRQLTAALADAIRTARTDDAPLAHSPGSLTVSNVGPFGVDGCAPVIAGDESVLLCVGAITRRPWVLQVDGEERLAIRDVCTLSLSFDQRFIDGERSGRFLADAAAGLNDPSRLDLS